MIEVIGADVADTTDEMEEEWEEEGYRGISPGRMPGYRKSWFCLHVQQGIYSTLCQIIWLSFGTL
ncbi:hypothetical protein HC762_01620 [bacterium]|nr:hypothetical protein [bacterium]